MEVDGPLLCDGHCGLADHKQVLVWVECRLQLPLS